MSPVNDRRNCGRRCWPRGACSVSMPYYLKYSPGRDTTQNRDRNAISLGNAQLCYVGSRIGWASAVIYCPIIQHEKVIFSMQCILWCQ